MEALVQLLLSLSALIGVEPYSVAARTDHNWQIQTEWSPNSKGILRTELVGPSPDKLCSAGQIIRFPSIVHGAQEIFIGDQLIRRFGDPEMKTNFSFYSYPMVDCDVLLTAIPHQLPTGDSPNIRWIIYSNTRYFARVLALPIVESKASDVAWNDTLHFVAIGALIILALYSFISGVGAIKFANSVGVPAVALFATLFFTFSTSGYLGLNFGVTLSHRLADLSLILVETSILYYLAANELLGRQVFKLIAGTLAACFLIVIFGKNGDQIQVGTTLSFLPTGLGLNLAVTNHLLRRGGRKATDLYSLLGLLFFAVSSTSDIFFTLGLNQVGMTLPIGFVGCALFFALRVNQEVKQTYNERDQLREGLEKEVEKKTQLLSARTSDLEKTLTDLRSTQAELIQSAKLASLGTLSAGIAHEINNSINFVNGALIPLERKILKLAPDEEKPGLARLMSSIKDGTKLTIEIVKSLRSYTGLNQAKSKDINLFALAGSVTTILKNRLREIQVENNIDPQLEVFGSVVGLNQVLMNLLTNAIDALPGEGGRIILGSSTTDSQITLSVSDNGHGIPPEAQSRIFDPFFTTKDVGSGTGLGLHIVANEIQKMGGSISFESMVGSGTTFLVTMPKNMADQRGDAA